VGLVEDRGYQVPRGEVGDGGPRSDDGAGAIGDGDYVFFEGEWVYPRRDHDIAVVEGDGGEFDENVVRTQRWEGDGLFLECAGEVFSAGKNPGFGFGWEGGHCCCCCAGKYTKKWMEMVFWKEEEEDVDGFIYLRLLLLLLTLNINPQTNASVVCLFCGDTLLHKAASWLCVIHHQLLCSRKTFYRKLESSLVRISVQYITSNGVVVNERVIWCGSSGRTEYKLHH